MAITAGNPSSTNIRTVKELILDEHKIVTYISLSKELCIHVNEAKTLLRQVTEEIKAKNNNTKLNISYLISGLSNNNAGRTTVCLESDLEEQKKSFKTIFYYHIYSVCEGSSGLDNAAFASLNKFEDFTLCGGLIKCNLSTKRSSDEIGKLKSNSQKIDEQIYTAPKKEIKEKSKDAKQNGHMDNGVTKVHETKSEPVIKSEVNSPKKVSPSTSNGKSGIKKGNKSAKNITGFFTKSNSTPNTKSTKINAAQEINIKPTPEVKNETNFNLKKESQFETKIDNQLDIENDDIMEVDEELPKKIKTEPVNAKNNNKKQSALSHTIKNAKVDKKRKRVLHVSDSDSDDNDPFADSKPLDHESDDEIPPTPTTNTIKITSGILNPKKRRKIVDKTYTDEDGYILTRKEEIYESCSEDDVEMTKTEQNSNIPVKAEKEKENVEITNKKTIEISPKEKKSKTSKKKVSPPQKGKQASIMNFFKKV